MHQRILSIAAHHLCIPTHGAGVELQDTQGGDQCREHAVDHRRDGPRRPGQRKGRRGKSRAGKAVLAGKQKIAGDQPAHAVPDQKARQTRVTRLDLVAQRVQRRIERLEGRDMAAPARRATVARVIGSERADAAPGQRLGHVPIAPAVLAEAVREQHRRARRRGLPVPIEDPIR